MPIEGKLLQVDPAEKTLTLEVTRKIPNLDAGEAQAIANLQVQLALAARNPNPFDRARQMQQIQADLLRHQQRVAQGKDQPQKVELQAADDAEVRLAHPPPAYDDKGNPRPLTARELADLKGPRREWGYAGSFDDLQPGLLLRVYVPKKFFTPPRGRPQPPTRDKEAAPERPLVLTIQVLGEAKK